MSAPELHVRLEKHGTSHATVQQAKRCLQRSAELCLAKQSAVLHANEELLSY